MLPLHWAPTQTPAVGTVRSRPELQGMGAGEEAGQVAEAGEGGGEGGGVRVAGGGMEKAAGGGGAAMEGGGRRPEGVLGGGGGVEALQAGQGRPDQGEASRACTVLQSGVVHPTTNVAFTDESSV